MNAVEDFRRRLGRVGVWLAPPLLLHTPAEIERREVARIERLGFGSVWSGELAGGKEAFAHHGLLLAATERIVVGTGIANAAERQASSMYAGGATLADAYPGRFLLGVGGAPGVGSATSPVARMREYLDRMDAHANPMFPPLRPEVPFPRVLAALGPRMLALAGELTDGVHPFLMPPAQTALSRDVLGPDKLVIPHQAVVLEPDPERARAVVREYFPAAATTPESPYTKNYLRLGFTPEDFEGDRSDRLVDTMVAWGDEEAIAKRVREHLDAGADHVLIHPLGGDLSSTVDQLKRLAPALL